MERIKENWIKKYSTFATVDKEGNPQARAFQIALIEDGKIYFLTAKSKEVYQQMEDNPNIAFTVASPDYVGLRVTGKVNFVNDLTLKENI
ncbi:pyridoxamine 5'-phosphate oxidase family protein [Halanaerobium saccharolyticum]|uniref:pyridoxamine 5'-phosphate oxidase family protein n=1 Tax=Halanaerobium saccharolyticum TaxID=43595 RepID=UPI000DBA7801|nr:pyridoxamine 5'-phosphate oxidase family protein [Halanaerobium saccharolyticum]